MAELSRVDKLKDINLVLANDNDLIDERGVYYFKIGKRNYIYYIWGVASHPHILLQFSIIILLWYYNGKFI